MHSFVGLVKKDMMLSRFGYVTWLIGTFLIMVGSYFLAVKMGEPLLITPFYIMLIVLHIPLSALTMLSLLRIEGKTQLWLYNPQGSLKLLLAKLSATAIFLVMSQLLFAVYGFSIIKWLAANEVNQGFVENIPYWEFLLVNAAFFAIAMFLAVWVVFLWTIYHSLGWFNVWKGLRWLVLLLIVVAYNTLEFLLMKITIFQKFVHSWTFEFNFVSSYHYDSAGWTVEYMEPEIPFMPIMLYALLALALFYAASRLLDKKVEV